MDMNMQSNQNMMDMKMDAGITWGTSCVTFLFTAFHAKSYSLFLIGCITTFLFSVFVQVIQQNSTKKFITGINSRGISKSCHDVGQTKSQSASLKGQQNKQEISLIVKLRLLLYYCIVSLLNLLLMLLSMSMNGYVILSIVFGVGVGRTIIDLNRKIVKGQKNDQKGGNIPEQSPKSDIQPNQL